VPSTLAGEGAVHLAGGGVEVALHVGQLALHVVRQDLLVLAHDRVFDVTPHAEGRVGRGVRQSLLERLPYAFVVVRIIVCFVGGRQHVGQVLRVVRQYFGPQQVLDPLLGGSLVGAVGQDDQVATARKRGPARRPRP